MSLGKTPFDERLNDMLRFTGNMRNKDTLLPIFILVVGMTGAGKSTLIQRCTGENDGPRIGHGLQSYTNDLSVHSFIHNHTYHIHMIDTPGFNDTSRSDIDTLRTISNYLSVSFTNGVRISGIIYLHRISDNRLSGSGFKNLRMFKKLSGSSTWPKTVIGTTMWQTDQHEQGERRESELVANEDHLGDMLAQGAKVFRVAEWGTGADEERLSALRIVSYLIQRRAAAGLPHEMELEIQRELVLEDKTLDDTAAGQEALGDLYGLRCQLTRQLDNAHEEMRGAVGQRDKDHMMQLRALEDDCKLRIQETEAQQEKLKTSLMDMNEMEMERVEARLADIEAQQRAAVIEKQQELEDMEQSLQLMREQNAIDAARRRQQLEKARKESLKLLHEQSATLDLAKELQKRDQEVQALKQATSAAEKLDRESERNLMALRNELTQQRAQMESIGKAKGAMRNSIGEGLASGSVGAVMSTVLPLVLAGSMCVVS